MIVDRIGFGAHWTSGVLVAEDSNLAPREPTISDWLEEADGMD